MPGLLVSVVQQKGGAGKTTVAAQLAVALSSMRKRTALLDLDPQASLTEWFEARKHWSNKPSKYLTIEPASDNLAWSLDDLRRSADIVLIDGPSHADSDTRIAIRVADLVIIPCQPRPLDVWATKRILRIVGASRRQAMLVLNRVPARSRMAARICKQMTAENWPVAKHFLGDRQAFAATAEIGHGVVEVDPDCRASREVTQLANEVLTRLGVRASSPKNRSDCNSSRSANASS